MPSVRVFFPPWTKEEILKRLKEGLAVLREEVPLRQAYLFGSWATGRALPGSDVDLLLIYQGPARGDLHRLARKAFKGLPVELHAYTEEEAKALEPLLRQMLAQAIPLLDS
ncbi:nucleotidyltransferase [Thermus scotoductus]|uniref:Nucleotidyltransferase n=1 Tax=Thermus scotoductus TaxID=37636 RepID=A0A0N0ZQH1_THESC|nr:MULTISPECIES: nucleotidyltransferase domain-containing protein [unclassified Thermus]ETN89520.1 nucleotidyltransferase [Thermus sp. NMX2.A1]KPD32854.1 nucleotidyltransferase [Thermus scotoductus]UZX15824.1 nucleotidyltransferase domain-containing protein [Thermus sp. PS18]